MAYDEGLAQRLREVLQSERDIAEKRMFGGLVFMFRGYMFVGITGELLMARVGPDDYEQALSRPHVRVMDFTGKPMRGYVYVDPRGLRRTRISRTGSGAAIDSCSRCRQRRPDESPALIDLSSYAGRCA